MPVILPSAAIKKSIYSDNNNDVLVALLEITNPDWDAPIRIANAVVDLEDSVGGYTYTALPFEINLPDFSEGRAPEAQIRVDNVGYELASRIQQTHGLRGARFRIMLVFEQSKAAPFFDATLDLLRVVMTPTVISATLGRSDWLNSQAVQVAYTPETQPGLF